jgi:hypothetical protein
MVKSSSLCGLAAGLARCDPMLGFFLCVVVRPVSTLDLLRTGLALGLFCVCGRDRAALVVVEPPDFLSDFTAGVFSGVVVVEGAILVCRMAYGSAVFGLFISGRRMGRRTVPLISEPVPVEVLRADFVESPDMADGGLAGPLVAVGAVDVVREPAPSDLVEIDLGVS